VSFLLPHHSALLTGSRIADGVAEERGYISLRQKAEVTANGFASSQARVPALLIPLHGVAGGVVGCQIRPDSPRSTKDGKLVKYETPAKFRMVLDVHPRTLPMLGNPKVPLIVTEGVRKADAAVTQGLAAVALLGVWNWRGSTDDGGKTALPDWESIALNDREVYLAFDSDVMTKPAVHAALARLRRFLQSRGAVVKVVYLPETNGAKVGLDDYFADGHGVDELLALAVDELRPPRPVPTPGLVESADAVRELHGAVRGALLDQAPAFDQRRHVAVLVTEHLRAAGRFLRTADGRIYYFRGDERRLVDMEGSEFARMLSVVSGLSATENQHRFVRDLLQAMASEQAPKVDVHSIAHYDAERKVLCVSDGAGGIWQREPGGDWTYAANGTDGVLFLTEPGATPFVLENGQQDALHEFINGFPLTDRGPLSRSDQRVLLLMFLLGVFFPHLRRTRMVPAFLGAQGSGKTSSMRRLGCLLVGSRFEVTSLSEKREDAFVAAICNRTVCGLDNADSRVQWLEDALATYATGMRYRLRKLYTTNEEVSYEPKAVLLISSRDPQFNRPDVAERLLTLHFDRPARYVPESSLFAELEARRGAVWGDLLALVAKTADGIDAHPAPAMNFRMADFAAFGWRAFAANGWDTTSWDGILTRLTQSQMRFASDGDGVVSALRMLLQTEPLPIGPIPAGDLYRRLLPIAEKEFLPFPKAANGFSRRLSNLRRVIEVELGVRLLEGEAHGGFKHVTLTAMERSAENEVVQ